MKAAVFSDTHGNTALMVEAVRRVRPDCIIHLGDYERDTEILRREFPETPLYNVCGNCDFAPVAPLTTVVQSGAGEGLPHPRPHLQRRLRRSHPAGLCRKGLHP